MNTVFKQMLNIKTSILWQKDKKINKINKAGNFGSTNVTFAVKKVGCTESLVY